jgi:hypothetical protein
MNKNKTIAVSPETKRMKRVFDLCNTLGDGIYGKLHLVYSLDNNRVIAEDQKQQYRGYHGDGYCFTITKEPSYTAEDEFNSSAIDGFEYEYSGDEFEGFKELSLLDCYTMLLNTEK